MTRHPWGVLRGNLRLLFNGVAASSITSWSDGQIVATVPSTATTGPVKVVNGGVNSNTIAFTNQLQKQVEQGKAPKTIDRVDKGIGPHEKDHVHFNDGSALNSDGTWKHGSRQLTNTEKDWLQKNGWSIPTTK